MNADKCNVPNCRAEYDIVVMGVQLCDKHYGEYCDDYKAGDIDKFMSDKRKRTHKLDKWVKQNADI